MPAVHLLFLAYIILTMVFCDIMKDRIGNKTLVVLVLALLGFYVLLYTMYPFLVL